MVIVCQECNDEAKARGQPFVASTLDVACKVADVIQLSRRGSVARRLGSTRVFLPVWSRLLVDSTVAHRQPPTMQQLLSDFIAACRLLTSVPELCVGNIF